MSRTKPGTNTIAIASDAFGEAGSEHAGDRERQHERREVKSASTKRSMT